MTPTIPLMVAISANPGIKHWSLFIDAANQVEKTIIQILGARQRYFRNIRAASDARDCSALIELCALSEIDAGNIEIIKDIAWDTHTRNEEANYSCQDFVLDVLGGLEEKVIVDAGSVDYQHNKDVVKKKRESWQ